MTLTTFALLALSILPTILGISYVQNKLVLIDYFPSDLTSITDRLKEHYKLPQHHPSGTVLLYALAIGLAAFIFACSAAIESTGIERIVAISMLASIPLNAVIYWWWIKVLKALMLVQSGMQAEEAWERARKHAEGEGLWILTAATAFLTALPGSCIIALALSYKSVKKDPATEAKRARTSVTLRLVKALTRK